MTTPVIIGCILADLSKTQNALKLWTQLRFFEALGIGFNLYSGIRDSGLNLGSTAWDSGLDSDSMNLKILFD